MHRLADRRHESVSLLLHRASRRSGGQSTRDTRETMVDSRPNTAAPYIYILAKSCSLGAPGRAKSMHRLADRRHESVSLLLHRASRRSGGQSTRDSGNLVLASDNLTDSMIKCAIYGTEHGSDHRAIETVFDSFMRSMIGSASPCLPRDTSSPPQSWSWRLKSPTI
jgi:hypothetical protein